MHRRRRVLRGGGRRARRRPRQAKTPTPAITRTAAAATSQVSGVRRRGLAGRGGGVDVVAHGVLQESGHLRRAAGRQRGGGVARTEPVEQLGRPRGHRSSRLLSFDSSCPAAVAGLSQLVPELLPRPVQPDARRVGRDVEDGSRSRRASAAPTPTGGAARRPPRAARHRLGEVSVVVVPAPGHARPAGRRPRSGPRAAPAGVRRAGRWPGSCGPRRRPRAAARPGRSSSRRQQTRSVSASTSSAVAGSVRRAR